ncbi:MAG: retropepsin-like aspartic protease family protein [Thalassovita sp.]
MDSWDVGRLAYLILLLVAVGSWYLTQRRGNLSKLVQQALIWVFLFLGVIAAVGLWGDIRQTVMPQQAVHSSGQIELPRAPDGHYYLTAIVNNEPIRFVVDTGASGIVMTLEDAERAGLDRKQLAFLGEAMTANGPVRTARVLLEDFTVGPYEDSNIRAWVNEGEMETSLLGMTYLQRFSKIEITPGFLLLTR